MKNAIHNLGYEVGILEHSYKKKKNGISNVMYVPINTELKIFYLRCILALPGKELKVFSHSKCLCRQVNTVSWATCCP